MIHTRKWKRTIRMVAQLQESWTVNGSKYFIILHTRVSEISTHVGYNEVLLGLAVRESGYFFRYQDLVTLYAHEHKPRKSKTLLLRNRQYCSLSRPVSEPNRNAKQKICSWRVHCSCELPVVRLFCLLGHAHLFTVVQYWTWCCCTFLVTSCLQIWRDGSSLNLQ